VSQTIYPLQDALKRVPVGQLGHLMPKEFFHNVDVSNRNYIPARPFPPILIFLTKNHDLKYFFGCLLCSEKAGQPILRSKCNEPTHFFHIYLINPPHLSESFTLELESKEAFHQQDAILLEACSTKRTTQLREKIWVAIYPYRESHPEKGVSLDLYYWVFYCSLLMQHKPLYKDANELSFLHESSESSLRQPMPLNMKKTFLTKLRADYMNWTNTTEIVFPQTFPLLLPRATEFKEKAIKKEKEKEKVKDSTVEMATSKGTSSSSVSISHKKKRKRKRRK
jgi:hypothetical protein